MAMKKKDHLRKLDKLVIRNRKTQQIDNVIFPNGLQVGLGHGNFDQALVVKGTISSTGNINTLGNFKANTIKIKDTGTRGNAPKDLTNFNGDLQWGGASISAGAASDTLGDLTPTDGNFVVGNGTDWVVESGATARSSLGVDAAGTDNSTNVTIASGRNYLTISGQEITCGEVDISDDTNLTAGTGITLTGDTLSVTSEDIQDIVGAMFTSNTETLCTVTYQDGDGTIDVVVDNDLSNYDNSSSGFITSTLTTEQVQDIVGAMFTSNTETRIAATYQDGDGTIDLEVDDMSGGGLSAASNGETTTGTSTSVAVTPGNLTSITKLGTIGTGVWQGTAINQTYLVGQSGTNTGDDPGVESVNGASTSAVGVPALTPLGGTVANSVLAGRGDGSYTPIASAGAQFTPLGMEFTYQAETASTSPPASISMTTDRIAMGMVMIVPPGGAEVPATGLQGIFSVKCEAAAGGENGTNYMIVQLCLYQANNTLSNGPTQIDLIAETAEASFDMRSEDDDETHYLEVTSSSSNSMTAGRPLVVVVYIKTAPGASHDLTELAWSGTLTMINSA